MNPKIISILLAACAFTAPAATIHWTNTLGGNWNAAANWSPNVVPTSADLVVISNDGTYTVTNDVSPTISALTVGGASGTQTLATASGVLTVNGPASIGVQGQLTLSGGTLSVTNGLNLHGTMIWSWGMVATATALTIASNGLLRLTGNDGKILQGTITNDGTIISTGTGALLGDGSLYNRGNGLWDAQSDRGFSGPRLLNDGTLRKSGGPGTSAFTATEFVNNGTIDAQTGTISLQGVTLGEGSRYIGAGTNLLLSGTMSGSFTSENLLLNAPGMGLAGTGTLHGSMVWFRGTIGAGAALTVAPDATLVLAAGTAKTLTGAITNAGMIKVAGGGVSTTASGILHILPGAVLEAQGDFGVGGHVINDGVIRKSAGSGTSYIGPLINNGVVDAQAGTIHMGGMGGDGATTLGEGSSYIGAGTISMSGIVTLAGSFTSENLVGGGSIVYMVGSGTLHGSMAFPVNLIIRRGAALTIATDSTLTLNTTFHIDGNLTNAGTITPSVSPRLDGRFDGGTLHNLASGIIDVKGNTSFGALGNPLLINDGIVRKSVGTGTNIIPANLRFINNGTVLAESGVLSFSGSLTNPAGTLAVMGGMIRSETPLILPGGLVTGSGIVEAPSITSAARVSPGASNAVLIISGNYTQQIGGSLEFDIAGANAGTNQSQVIVTGSAHLNGSVGVRLGSGYSPDAGISNIVLTAASLTGGFKCFDGFLLLGENKRLNVSYSPTNVVLVAASVPDPTGPHLSIAREEQALICWPSEFVGYDLRFKTNLTTSEWTLIPGATNRHLDSSLAPQKFFQLIKQP